MVLLAQTPFFRCFMNDYCDRGRILLIVTHANVTVAIFTLSETPPLASSVMQEAHLAWI